MSFYQNVLDKIFLIEKQIKDRKNEEESNPVILSYVPDYKSVHHFSFLDFREHLKLSFWKFVLVLTEIYLIIRGAPASNFNVFTRAGKDGVYICNYSYCHYKGINKNAKWKFISMVTVATVIVSLVVALIFPGKPVSHAATINWLQSSWSGGASGVDAKDPDDRTLWANYSEKDDNITAGATLSLTEIAGTPTTETADTDFNEGTINNIAVSATDIKLSQTIAAPDNSGTDLSVSGNCTAVGGTLSGGKCNWTPADTTTISGNYYNIGTLTIPTGNVYTPTGSVLQLKADNITITGTLNGSGKGENYGAGDSTRSGGAAGSGNCHGDGGGAIGACAMDDGGTGGGGGHGGAGATGSGQYSANAQFSGGSGGAGTCGDQNSYVIELGSGGGGGGAGDDDQNCDISPGGNGGRGGGAVHLYATGTVAVNGSILVNGDNGNDGGCAGWCDLYGGGGGGGAGGGILINANVITIDSASTLKANGGNGGLGSSSYGGAGGGGRIKLFYGTSLSVTDSDDCGDTGSIRCIKGTGGRTAAGDGTLASGSSPLVYNSSGTFTSQILNTGQKNSSWGNLSWSADTLVPSGTSIEIKVRSCADATCSANPAYATATTITTGGAGTAALSGVSSLAVGHQYVQYQAVLNASSDGASTPTFSDITINHNHYSSSQTLTSSAFDTGDDGVVINSIGWTETVPGGTNVKLKVRTASGTVSAPDAWGPWCGPGNAANCDGGGGAETFYETTPAGETINTTQSDASSDRWIQYKVWLTGDGSAASITDNVNIEYIINTSPKFCKVDLTGTPADCPNGETAAIVAIQNTSGANAGKVTLTSDYPSADSNSYPIADNEEGTGSGKDLDGKISIQYFYNAGATLNNSGPVGTTDTQFIVSDPNGVLPSAGTIMIDNDLASAAEKVEVISYTTKTGTTTATLGNLTRATWPAESGDAGYTTQKTTHTNSSKVWILATSATVKGEVFEVSSSPKTISTSSLTFTPSTDLASPVYLNNTAVFRIAVNDGNLTNQVVVLDSAIFTIDTKVPVGDISGTNPAIPVRVDLPNSRLDITVSDTAGSTATYMRFSNSDITGASCADESGVSWMAYPGGAITKILSELSLSAGSASAYTVYYQFKDDYCNMLTGSASSPAAPTGIDKADISYKGITPAKYRDLIWWTAQGGSVTYELWRDPGTGTYAKLGDIADPTNYCFDEGDGNCTEASPTVGTLTSTTVYNYKVLAKTNNGISNYSESVSVTPDGSTTGEAPVLTAPTIAASPAPAPDSGADSSSVDSATITWTTEGTNASSNSIINYGTNSTTLGSLAGSATAAVTSHSVGLSNLDAGTTYYYQIISGAVPGNQMKDPATPPTGIHSFVTSAPSVVSPFYVAGTTSASIYWTTTGKARSQIRYIAGSGDPSGEALSTISAKTTVHYAAITGGLTASTTYNYQIVLTNGDGSTIVYPTAASTYYTFTTADLKADEIDPIIVDTSSATQAATSADIIWTTVADSSYSIVEYGSTSALGYVAGTVASADFTESHSVSFSNLTPGTVYHYKIRSADASGNLTTSPSSGTGTFTTADLSISGGSSSSPSRSNAIITWTTNGLADSRVEYGTTATLSNAIFSACPVSNTAVDSCTILQDTTNKVIDHIVSVSGLSPDTTYYYRVLSRNGEGTYVASDIASFLTTAGDRPTITAGSAAAPSDNSATVAFSAASNNSTALFLSVEYVQSASTPASSGYSSESAPTAASSGASGTVNILGLASDTTYYYRLKARDVFGNTKTDDNGGAGYSFRTTKDIIAPVITSNNVSVASTSAVITWTTSNEASTSEVKYGITKDGSNNPLYELSETTPAINANYNIDHSITLSLDPEKTYYYKIISADATGNSCLATPVASPADICPTGSFTTPIQVDTTIPVITAVSDPPGTIGATSAVITWTTARNSSSLVDFALAANYPNSIFTQGNFNDDTKTHSVTLVGLAPGTPYRFRVKSMDTLSKIFATDDNAAAGYLFTTQDAVSAGTLPEITSVQSSGITSNSAVISWVTVNVASDSTVGYSEGNKTYVYEKGLAATGTSHSVTLTNLTPFTDYFYQVKSRNGNELAALSTDLTYPAGFTFKTLAGADNTPPNIWDIQVASVTSNKATITWTTNKNADSFVEFGTVSGAYTSVQGNPSDSVIVHSVQLTSLTPDTQYYFQVRSTDAGGNKAVMIYTAGFKTTEGDAVDCPAPISCRTLPIVDENGLAADVTAPKITNIKVSDITFNTAAITWDTDENSSSMVGYDIVSEGVKKVFDYSSGQTDDAVKIHKVILRSLDSNTPYFFRVSSADQKGNVAKSDQQTFTTLSITQAKDKGAATAENLKKQFEDIAKTLVKDNLATEENIMDIISRIANPPIMGQEGPIVKDVKSYGATVVWSTDRKANSIVKFTVSENNEKPLASGASWREISKTDIFDTKHEVSLLGLAPSTSYFFQVLSQDILGNVATSEIKNFTTSSSSSIFNVAITDPGLTQATINWETANLSTSSLEWGLEATYGNYKDNADEKTKKHSIKLENLSSGTTYHYRVRSVEEGGSILSSDDYIFITPELPQIIKYELGEVKDNTVSLTWTSNIPIDSTVRYTNKETNETKIQTKEEKITDHTLVISSLEAGKTYSIEIQGRDETGNLASAPAFDVQTGMDTAAPEISQVRSQSATTGGSDDKVQAIISWRTNELSSTQLLWDIGATRGDTFANETKADTNLTTNHIVVVTQFKSGTVYRYRVISTDKFGNKATSPDYTILTPIKRQSIIQMIVNQFESIFGWVSKIGG